MLLDHGKIMPYYFYQCDDPQRNTGDWHSDQHLHDIMGYLPGFATPVWCATYRCQEALGASGKGIRSLGISWKRTIFFIDG
jgi:hypothetical protein